MIADVNESRAAASGRKRRLELTGRRFGRLTCVASRWCDEREAVLWHCTCDCGGVREVVTENLMGGRVKSCGCLRAEILAAGRALLKRSAPAVISSLKARVLALVLSDEPAKTIAAELSLAPNSACRWIHVLGFRLMYVTREERAHLMARRKATT